VASMVDAANGKIDVTSEPNQGTTFTIRLPAFVGDVSTNGGLDVQMPFGQESLANK